MKRCADCRQWKPNDQFPRNRNSKDGRHCYCKDCNNARSRESRERLHGGARHYHLKHRYGIGADEVDALIESQGNRCPICDRRSPNHVDHDHETGVVRGLLCFTCNGALAIFTEDDEHLTRAADYVNSGGFVPSGAFEMLDSLGSAPRRWSRRAAVEAATRLRRQ